MQKLMNKKEAERIKIKENLEDLYAIKKSE